MERPEFDRLAQLLNDADFKGEIRLYNRSYQRLKVRLRNNKLIGDLKQLKKLISRLLQDYKPDLFTKLKTSTSKKLSITIRHTCEFVKSINNILDKFLYVYRDTQPHYLVGHLIQHLLVIRSCVARLTICFKALLVYSSDLYLHLSTTKTFDSLCKTSQSHLLTRDEINNILKKHHCKPREEQETTQTDDSLANINDSAKIGQLIDRATLRPRTNSK